ncbi:MAG: ABC transporter ATP-binding protein [Candidatus Methylomirabilia bacterium]
MREKIRLDNVIKAFRVRDVQSGREKEFVAVNGVSFAVGEGERVALIGATGCGKSTCLNIINGLIPVSSGRVEVDGVDPYAEFAQLKRKIAVVFQTDRLLPWRTALDNAAVGLEILGYSKQARQDLTREWLAKLGLESFENRYPHELSGGMRQRVSLARAFALDPSILVLDEAFGHLDEVTARRLRNDFLQLVTTIDEHKRAGTTVVFVTHNIEEAIEVGNRVIALDRPARVLTEMRIDREARSDLALAKEYRQKLVATIGDVL